MKIETLLLLILGLIFASGLQAAEMGKFTRVEGQVELLKAGQSPGKPAEAQTGVEEKDVIHTGPESRAQLHFLDDTTLIIAPESRITIESYMYDPQKGKRQTKLAVTQGLLQAVVTKIFKDKDPDFLVETQTAIMGVRGTEFYVLVMENPENQEDPAPKDTSGFSPDFLKALRVRAAETPHAPVLTDVFVKAGRVSMNSSNPNIKETMLLGPQQSTRVVLNKPPAPRINLTPKDFQRLKSSLITGVTRARIGHTRNPRDLLERLPVTPPPPGAPLSPGGVKSRPEGKLPPGPAAKPPGSMTPAKAKEKPPPAAAKGHKPGEKPPGPAAKPPAMTPAKSKEKPPPATAKAPKPGEKPRGPAAKPLKPGEKPPSPAAKPPKPGEKAPAAAAKPPPKGAPPRVTPPKPAAEKKPAPAKKKEPAKAPAKAPAAKPKEPPPKKPTPPGAAQP